MSNGGTYGSDWSANEVASTVQSYFQMLSAELERRPYSKAEARRSLQSIIDRTDGSIEYKHQNISAVLEELGWPQISGYKPARNFQRLLVDEVERQISQWRSLIDPDLVVASGFGEAKLAYLESPPSRIEPQVRLPQHMKSLVRKLDPAERDFRMRSIGEAGERFVLQFEETQLRSLGRDDLADSIEWVSKEVGDGAGFDIRSFSPSGADKFIEVKTTVGASRTPFYMTRNERAFAEGCAKGYSLYRVYDFRKERRIFELTPPLDQFVTFTPDTFKAHF